MREWGEAAKPTQLQTRKPNPEPATLTRPYLPFLATVSAELGTNLKLRSRPSFPCHPRRRKATGTPAIEAWKPATVSLCSAGIFAGFGWHHRLDFCSPRLPLPFPTIHYRPGHHFAVDRSLKDLWLWELDPEPSPCVGGHHHHRCTQCG